MNTERFSILAHLIITMTVLLIYTFIGENDTTMQTVLTIVIGYWFGSMGNTVVRKSNS